MSAGNNFLRVELLVRTLAATMVLTVAASQVHAFEFGPHRSITSEGLRNVQYPLDDDFLSFSDDAVDRMTPLVEWVDISTLAGLLPDTAKFHCDSDLVTECAHVVAQQIDTLVDGLIEEGEIEGPVTYETYWKIFAATLHTVQDFYTHTNWVEINGAYDFANFGERADLAFAPSTLGGPGAPCRGGNGTTTVPNLSRLGSGFFPLPSPLGLINGLCAHGPLAGIAGISKDHAGRPNYQEAYDTAVRATTMLAMKVLIRLEQVGAYRAMCVFLGQPRNRCEDAETMAGTFSASGSSVIGYVGGCTAPMAWTGNVVINGLDTTNPVLVFTGSRTFGPTCLNQVDPMGPWSVPLTRNGRSLTGNTGTSSNADTIYWNLTIAVDGALITGTFLDEHYYQCCGSYAAGSASGTVTLRAP